ncbi:MAG: Lrp/AsnC family transcriptional regulator [Thermoproteaceae archaeon]|jgi:DNA-binding Lrp family transcriptional regulator|nr:Lrp/AsnC family transcriptional regulator [Thermoproteaceae archaeon]
MSQARYSSVDRGLKSLLMEVQYSFPIVERPYRAIGKRLGEDESWVIERLREAMGAGILKRIGAVLNYKTRGMVAALVGMAVPDSAVEEVAAEINRDPHVTHNFQRDFRPYNLWFVVRGHSAGELESRVSAVARKYEVDYVILYSLRTYKLDVRFDLDRGISWAPGRVMPESPPSVYELGIPAAFFAKVKSLPLAPEPFREAAEALGLPVAETLRKIQWLIEVGVLRNLHGVLDGCAVGFRENIMVAVREPVCETAAMLDITTHVVLRSTVPGKWEYPCYFMVHGVSRDVVEDYLRDAVKRLGVREYVMLYSVKDFLGGQEMGRRVELASEL